LQDGSTVVVGGKTNRAKLEFSEEMNRLLDKVPELISADENVLDTKSTATCPVCFAEKTSRNTVPADLL